MVRVELYQYTAPVITLSPEKTINDALQLMQKNDIKRIVIVKNNLPEGIVTERDIGKFLEKDKTIRTLDQIPLDEIMSTGLVTITLGQQDHLIQCAIRMETFQISSVIVVDDDGKLIGITTKSDLAKNFANIYLGVYKVKDYMSRKVITCRKSDSLFFVLNMLNKNKVARIVVTDNDGKPIGIITYDTFLRNSEYFKTGKQNTRNYLLPKTSAKEMNVDNVIGNELLIVESEEDLAKAAKLMTEFKVSGVPTIDKDGNLEGVISASDIARAYSEVETHFRLIEKDPHFD
ncbi:MAG: CBS domain-containing protein [Nitrosopumilaceae archaeon]